MKDQDVVVPFFGESVVEVTLSKFFIHDGERVEKGFAVCELESEKASMEITAPFSGCVHYHAKEGSTLKIGETLFSLREEESAKVDANAREMSSESKEKERPSSYVDNSLVEGKEEKNGMNPILHEKMFHEGKQEEKKALKDISEKKIRESCQDFLVNLTYHDVDRQISNSRHSESGEVQKKEMMEQLTQNEQSFLSVDDSEIERRPLSKLRRVLSQRLVRMKNETAMLTTINEVDLTHVVALRNAEKERFQKDYGQKLTYLPFFVKAVVAALKLFPEINAYIDGNDIVYHRHVNMGIAVSTERGLVVPVIRSVDNLSFVEIVKNIVHFAQKSREKKLTIADMTGGTFTITNPGVFGSLFGTPMLNPPQSGILGMNALEDRPVVRSGQIVARSMMYLSFSYDHRVIDGKEATLFLMHVKKVLEDPTKFIMDNA